MMRALPALAMALVLSAAIAAQVGVDGKWETAAPGFTGPESDKITFDLKATGGKLTGTIARTDPPGQKPVVIEGKVEGNTIAFTY